MKTVQQEILELADGLDGILDGSGSMANEAAKFLREIAPDYQNKFRCARCRGMTGEDDSDVIKDAVVCNDCWTPKERESRG